MNSCNIKYMNKLPKAKLRDLFLPNVSKQFLGLNLYFVSVTTLLLYTSGVHFKYLTTRIRMIFQSKDITNTQYFLCLGTIKTKFTFIWVCVCYKLCLLLSQHICVDAPFIHFFLFSSWFHWIGLFTCVKYV